MDFIFKIRIFKNYVRIFKKFKYYHNMNKLIVVKNLLLEFYLINRNICILMVESQKLKSKFYSLLNNQ
jgi:hypothetical protein